MWDPGKVNEAGWFQPSIVKINHSLGFTIKAELKSKAKPLNFLQPCLQRGEGKAEYVSPQEVKVFSISRFFFKAQHLVFVLS